jgi:hypothetical protein
MLRAAAVLLEASHPTDVEQLNGIKASWHPKRIVAA